MKKITEKGITLIALVVIIVVLLILAGVSINLVLGNNGIIAKAQAAVSKTEYKAIDEAITLKLSDKYFGQYEDIDKEEYLRIIGWLDSAGVLNISKTGIKTKKGNGSWDEGDLYIITNNMLRYYNSNKKFSDVGPLVALDENVFNFEESTGMITGIKDGYTVENMVIPKIISNKEVKGITAYAFQNREELKNVVIHADLAELPTGLFETCSNLESVTLNSTLKTIGRAAFQKCTSLKSINLTDTMVEEIGDLAFESCNSLTSVIIPNTVTVIGENAFDSCSGLTEVTIPETVTTLKSYAFVNCTGVKYFNILGKSKTTIEANAFGGTTSLINIRFECDESVNPSTWNWGPDPAKAIYNQDLSGKYNSYNDIVKNGRLSVLNGKLVNSSNQIVQLNGLSLTGLQWSTNYVSNQTFKYLKNNWNINLIRIPIIPKQQVGWMTYDDTLQWIDKAVQYATANGMYIILNFHVVGDPSEYTEEAETLFNDVSSAYKDNTNVIYEIFNEPATTSSGTNVTWSSVKTYADSVIAKIRANDLNNVIICGTASYSTNLGDVIANPLSDNKTMYSFHFYAGTHKLGDYKNLLDNAINNKLPIFISECSTVKATGESEVAEDESKKWLSYIKDNKLSWVYWNLSNAKDDYAAIIKNDCEKTSNWEYSDLTSAGQWIYNYLTK